MLHPVAVAFRRGESTVRPKAGARWRPYLPSFETVISTEEDMSLMLANAPLLLATAPVLIAAIGYSILYLLLGGGFGGAVIIFIVAKLLRR
jgi:hypothetical protein